MSVSEERAVTRETLRCWAREVVGMELAEADLEALLPMVAMVLAETDLAVAFDRAGQEPPLRFALEEWRR